jgi:signal transduction histidine kinase
MDVITTATPHEQSELFGLAVHELRTPVTVVAGYLRMLVREQLGPLTDRQRKAVEEAEHSCARLAALLAEMSELATLDGPDAPTPHDDVALTAGLDEICGHLEEGRDRGVVVVRTGTRDLITVRGDRKRLAAALSVLVRAIAREQDEAVRVAVDLSTPVREGRRMALVRVAIESALESGTDGGPEARLNEYRGGLGLGLPIARRVIEQAGGRVWSLGEGKRLGAVTVLLPVKESLP